MLTVSVRRGRGGAALVCMLGLLAAAGCGGMKKVPVSGTATLDGQPLNAGVIHFYPNPAKGNEHRVDCLGPVRGGKFNLLTTAVRDADSGSGVPVGSYKVYLDTTMPGAETLKIHQRFTDPAKTPIEVEVVENPAPGAYDIVFTSK